MNPKTSPREERMIVGIQLSDSPVRKKREKESARRGKKRKRSTREDDANRRELQHRRQVQLEEIKEASVFLFEEGKV